MKPTPGLLLVLALMLPSLPMAAAQGVGFPVTIENAFGTTVVAEAPKRVVSIGYVEQDFLYQLGIAPVGVREWFGDYPYATWPWAEAARQAVGATPQVFSGEEINLEWVLQQDPDLIVGTFVDMDQQTYDALSRIAPVVALPRGYASWSAPWQEELRDIDEATSGDTGKGRRDHCPARRQVRIGACQLSAVRPTTREPSSTTPTAVSRCSTKWTPPAASLWTSACSSLRRSPARASRTAT